MTGGKTAGKASADNHDVIRVVGARENNLQGVDVEIPKQGVDVEIPKQGVDVEIPKRRLTVFTGVSGSGKSSMVFATIAAESRRFEVVEHKPETIQIADYVVDLGPGAGSRDRPQDVVGFAVASAWHSYEGYARTVEGSIYLSPQLLRGTALVPGFWPH